MTYDLHHGDCLEVLRSLPDCSVDAVITDPPYGLSFMGKKWDYDVPSEEVWAECLRVLKPGGHLLAFAGTRTQHRMAVRIEDAGFEIRDMIAWVYGSGFPKSLDVSKAIDKAAGAEREVIGFDAAKAAQQTRAVDTAAYGNYAGSAGAITAPATDAARQWQGWGTALKPALEPITVARKPLIGTVAQNVLEHGTGAINVDGCRVASQQSENFARPVNHTGLHEGWDRPWKHDPDALARERAKRDEMERKAQELGRWPANLIHDGSDEVVGLFPQAGGGFGVRGGRADATVGNYGMRETGETVGYGDTGSAARFFYCAKASKRDRDEGLEGFEQTVLNMSGGRLVNTSKGDGTAEREIKPRANVHPTVKPTDLMRYLCRLVTPPGGTVLDPFMGSGSTGKAAILEGFSFIGIERESEYIEIARARIDAVSKQPKQQSLFK